MKVIGAILLVGSVLAIGLPPMPPVLPPAPAKVLELGWFHVPFSSYDTYRVYGTADFVTWEMLYEGPATIGISEYSVELPNNGSNQFFKVTSSNQLGEFRIP